MSPPPQAQFLAFFSPKRYPAYVHADARLHQILEHPLGSRKVTGRQRQFHVEVFCRTSLYSSHAEVVDNSVLRSIKGHFPEARDPERAYALDKVSIAGRTFKQKCQIILPGAEPSYQPPLFGRQIHRPITATKGKQVLKVGIETGAKATKTTASTHHQ